MGLKKILKKWWVQILILPTIIVVMTLLFATSAEEKCANLRRNLFNTSFKGIVVKKTDVHAPAFDVLLQSSEIKVITTPYPSMLMVNDSAIQYLGDPFLYVKPKGELFWSKKKYLVVIEECKCDSIKTYPFMSPQGIELQIHH